MKTKRKKQKNVRSEIPENMLPQNIFPVGGKVEADKNIYISQAVYKEIHKFTKNKTTDESGGILLGTLIEEFGKKNIVINGFVEAKYCEATPTTLTFTHETWEYVHKEIEKKHKGKKILGWIHTHPDFGIFLSEYDKFIHQNFFNEDSQVAYVIDPIQNIEGFYFWNNGTLEKCAGFYVYDKTGAKITIDLGNEETLEDRNYSSFDITGIFLALLSVAVVFLIFSNISTNKKLKALEAQQQNVYLDLNQMYQQVMWGNQDMAYLQNELFDLKSTLTANGILPPVAPAIEDTATEEIIVDSQVPETTDEGSLVNE